MGRHVAMHEGDAGVVGGDARTGLRQHKGGHRATWVRHAGDMREMQGRHVGLHGAMQGRTWISMEGNARVDGGAMQDDMRGS